MTPTQHVAAWDLDEQSAIVQAQMELADKNDLPLILHTPNQTEGLDGSYCPGVGVSGYEKNVGLTRPPVIESDNPALEAVKIDVDAMRDAGLADERVVASHVDTNNIQYLRENTHCYVSFTVGYPWRTGVTAADVADPIDTYGSERIMIDTDCANVLRTDPFALKRAIFEMYKFRR